MILVIKPLRGSIISSHVQCVGHFAQITDEGLKEVAKLQKLKTLRLADTQITDAGLKEVAKLQKLTQLEWLLLGRNQLTDVMGLEKLTQLKVLSLLDNPNLTKAQIDELQKALPKCKIYSNPTK